MKQVMFLIQLCNFWSPELQQVMSVHQVNSYPPLGGTRGRAERRKRCIHPLHPKQNNMVIVLKTGLV